MKSLMLVAAGAVLAWMLLPAQEPKFAKSLVSFGEHLGQWGGPSGLLRSAESADQAREALRMFARVSPLVAFDGEDRLCIVGATSVSHLLPDGSASEPSLATACLFDLRTADGWRNLSLWSSESASEVTGVEFQGNHLLVAWKNLAGNEAVARIEWAPRTDPEPGEFEWATQHALAADAAPRRR